MALALSRDARRSLNSLNRRRTVAHTGNARVTSATCTAEDLAIAFDAVADNSAFAVSARRSHSVNRALEAVEYVGRSILVNFKALIVIVATNFTLSHCHFLLG
jgi:hypothetical protein